MSPDWPVIKKVNTIFTYEKIRKRTWKASIIRGFLFLLPMILSPYSYFTVFTFSVIFILKSFEASIFLKVK